MYVPWKDGLCDKVQMVIMSDSFRVRFVVRGQWLEELKAELDSLITFYQRGTLRLG